MLYKVGSERHDVQASNRYASQSIETDILSSLNAIERFILLLSFRNEIKLLIAYRRILYDINSTIVRS